MARRQKVAVLMTAAVSLSISMGHASAGPIEDQQRQLEDQQKEIQDLTARQRLLEQQLLQEKQDRETKQQQLQTEQAQPKDQSASQGLLATGDFPGSFKIPGTDTSLRIGGYVKLDIIHDIGPPQGDFLRFFSIPLDGTVAARRQGSTRLDARQSRINVETRSPTALGTAKTFIEGDFFGTGGDEFASNSTTFRLRHAYAELGPVLAGQTWSNFMDVESLPEVVDFNGPAGQIFIRQGQLRYTHTLAPAVRVSAAIENPQGDFFGPGTTGNPPTGGADAAGVANNSLNQYPDFTVRFATDQPWGHLAFAGLARQIQANVLTTGRHADDFGYGLSLGGTINIFDRDRILYQINGGTGIGRYLQDGIGSGAAFNGTSLLNSQSALGAFAGYQHWWTETIRSTVVYGYDRFDNNTRIVGLTNNRTIESLHANIFWSPVKSANIALEYVYGRRVTDEGQHGEANRLQVGFQYNF
jgi:DcaP outer membrane protein